MKRKLLFTVLLCVFMIGSLVGCQSKSSEGNDTSNFTLILVEEDGKEYKYDLNVTDGITLREALIEGKLIDEEQQAAMFIENIDGHVAKMEDGVLWMICDENGTQIQGLVDDITVTNGQTIKMVYTVAPNYDD